MLFFLTAVVNALVACGVPPDCCMGLVPRGQGPHDIAASLKIPTNVSEALHIAAAGRCQALDLGVLNKKKVGTWSPGGTSLTSSDTLQKTQRMAGSLRWPYPPDGSRICSSAAICLKLLASMI